MARFLSVSVRKIEHMMDKKLIPFLKIVGAVRFIPEEVRRFVETYFRPNNSKGAGNGRKLN